MSRRLLPLPALLASIVLLSVTACGGGGGGSSTSSNSISITGVAAVGAPLPNATVTIKDSNGAERTATTDANGEYTISDASGLVPPLVVRAQGTVGGETVTVYSVLPTALSTSNVVNITPATQAILEQAAAAFGADVFASASSIAAIDASKVTDANNALRTALSNVLTSAGASNSATIDFVSSPFRANSTGVDKVIDLYQISSQSNNTAKDILLRDKSAGTTSTIQTGQTNPTPVSPTAATSLDLVALRTWFTDFNAAMANNKTGLVDMFHANFKHSGKDRTTLTNALALDTRLQSPTILGCSAAQGSELAKCVVQAQMQDGTRFTMPFVFDTDGGANVWKAYGNQFKFEFDIQPKIRGWYMNHTATQDVFYFTSGVSIHADATVGSTVYPAIKVSYTLDDSVATPQWTDLAILTRNNVGCAVSEMMIQNACTDYVPVSDTVAQQIEQARRAGTFKVMVAPLTDAANSNSVDNTNKFATRQRGMSGMITSDAQRQAIRGVAGVVFTGPGNTGVLTFTGINADGFGLSQAWWDASSQQDVTAPLFFRNTKESVAALNGRVSLSHPEGWFNIWVQGRVNYGIDYEIHMRAPTP